MIINPYVFGERAKLGYIYNLYAIYNVLSAPTNWGVPSKSDFDTLAAYVTDGGDLKESGLTWWNTPNTGADNSSGFTARGSGYRGASFSGLKTEFSIAGYGSTQDICDLILEYNNTTITVQDGDYSKDAGYCVRMIYSGTGTPESTITDFDGNVYDVVQIGTQYWTVQNWKCTQYSEGNSLTKVTDQTTWNNAEAGDYYYCAYDNDNSLV
ncbi:hypothetical protein RPMD05_88 [Rhodobacteraceae phage LS06-2018-MD05]|nr:hypothetical protein RPMD05_88 [Rhodobacteraceae phage LS06-2018-MD05]